jgi:hypothetical protein
MTFDFDSLERLLAEHNRMTSPYTGERRYVCDALVEAAPSLIALAKRAQEAEAVRDEFQEQAKRAGDKCERMERVVEAVRLQRKTAAEHGRPFEATDPVGLALRALEEK